MKKGSSFFRQAGVLINRYFHIFLNDKQNLILTIGITLLTILIVCLVACKDMYAVIPEEDHTINDKYPVLVWETVIQEEKSDDSDEHELIEPDEVTLSKWNGSDVEVPSTPTKMEGEHYFLITNAAQLAFLSEAAYNEAYEDYLTYNYLLQVDIDLKSKTFKPIGTKDEPFTGTFDGNGHIIKNLKIKTDDNYVGLFGYVCSNEDAKETVKFGEEKMTFYHNGIVKNLQVQDANIKTDGNYVGIIAGCIDDTARIFSVSAKYGEIDADKDNVGGIVGAVKGDEAEIYSCYSTATIEAKGENVGGIVGDLGSGRLSAAYTTSEIIYKGKNDPEHFGAIVGNCEDEEDSLKNVFYDSTLSEDYDDSFKAIDDKNYDGIAEGVETEKLYNYASFLVPFKGIETAYDIANPVEDDDDDEKDDDDYDPEKDDDIDEEYGFKKDAQLSVFGGTQTGLFMLVCVAIFVGICNSIQEICKERNILKREYMTNLSLGSYVVSKLVVQAVVCAVQMLVVILIFSLFVRDKALPESGVIFGSVWVEYYITMFLLAFAADTMSLVVSSIVKNSATANTFIPIILIVQIVFSGVLFKMSGIMDTLSYLMISKWGISALAATSGLNDAQPIFLIDNPAFQLQLGSEMSTVADMYAGTPGNLLKIWGVLLLFIVVCSVACRFLLVRVKSDKR